MFMYLKTLPALALAGTLGLFWAPDAAAQNASNLDCNKCVGTGDLAKKAVTGSRLRNKAVSGRKIKNGAVSESKLSFDVATQKELDRLQAQVDAVSVDQGEILSHLLPKTVFVTSNNYTGNMGGPEGADMLCQAAADDPLAVVPSGDYVAWLSTDTVDARDRITQSLGPYVRPDGRLVAKSYADVINTDNTLLLSRIDVDELGGRTEVGVWTATDPRGIEEQVFNTNCSGWMTDSGTDTGPLGQTISTDTRWTQSFNSLSCNSVAHLYCFQR